MQYAWLTDIHLNFIDDFARKKFYQEIVNTQCDGVLISGDIAEAPSLVDILNEMASYINKPIYFILGNHDYYKGQINEVREAMTILTKENNKLFWLPASKVQQLTSTPSNKFFRMFYWCIAQAFSCFRFSKTPVNFCLLLIHTFIPRTCLKF
jgi:predicted MPP superfamily phosphohydrolase